MLIVNVFMSWQSENRKVLSSFLNLESLLAFLMLRGSLLYSLGAAELKVYIIVFLCASEIKFHLFF